LGLAGSFWAHGLLLAVLAVLGARGHLLHTATPAPLEAAVALPPAPVSDPIPIDVRTIELLAAPLPAEDEVAVAPPPDGAEADRDRALPLTVAPRDAEGRERAAPAADQGERGVHRTEPAFRRDRSTLHARLTDGAVETQAPRLHTARSSASPQAVRRERVTGIGDQVATRVPTRVPLAARQESTPRGEAPGTDATPSTPGAAVAAARAEAHPEVAQPGDRPVPERGVGPLAAESGARSFDAEARGPAADDRDARAASNERRPGITDFSHAGVTAADDGLEGRGPGSAPGAVARPARGDAPAEYGAHDPRLAGPEVAERAQQRRYWRYVQEISQRVNRIREFPKQLALRLEQGETIVEFVVRTDGQLGDGPRVVKSSGFEEFDSAAMRAVLRAAPFPPMPGGPSARPLPVSLRVAFENPLVR
jgi:TonB family protein